MSASIQSEFSHISNLFQAGRMQAAEAAAKDALGRYPRSFFLHNIMGAICGVSNRWKDASRHFKKALKFEPKNFEGLRNLANAERKLGNMRAAHGHLIAALKIKPGFAEGWCSLGVLYMDKPDLRKAAEAFQNTLTLKPDHAEAALNLMVLAERANRLDDLRGVLKIFGKAYPGHDVYRLFEGILLASDGEDAQARDLLAAVEFDSAGGSGNMVLELLRVNHLARINDRLDNADDAFSFFEKARALEVLQAKDVNIDPTRYQNALAARISYFSDDFDGRWVTPSNCSVSPVFLIGFPRSGVDLLGRYLQKHSGIAIVKNQPLVAGMRRVLGTLGSTEMAVLDGLETRKLEKARAVYHELTPFAENEELVIDSFALNLVHIGEILRVFPKARFVLAVRDPADTALSCFMQTFQPNDAMSGMTNPLGAAKIYDSAMQIWAAVEKRLKPAYVTCRYEDLITNPEAALAPVVSFLDLPWQGDILSETDVSGPSDGSMNNDHWQKYAHLMPEALEILGPWRKHFSYCD